MPKGKRIVSNNKRKTVKTKRCKRMMKFTGYSVNDILNDAYNTNIKRPTNDNEDAQYDIILKKDRKSKIKKAIRTTAVLAGALTAAHLGKKFYDKNKEGLEFIKNRGSENWKNMMESNKKLYNKNISPYLSPVIKDVKDYIRNIDFIKGYRNYYQDGINDKLEVIQSLLSNNPYDVDTTELKSIIENMEKQVEGEDEFKVKELKKITKEIFDGIKGYDNLTKQVKDGQQTGTLGINSLNNMIWNAREQYNNIKHSSE